MENTRLISLLKTLDKKEWRELHKYVRSPFFNQREDLVQLFDLLRDYLKHQKPIPDKAILFKKLYGNITYDDHKIRMVMSFLLKNVEQFLLHNSVFSDKAKMKTQLANIYRKRNLPKHFERTLNDAKNLLKASPYRNAGYYQNNFFLYFEEVEFTSRISRTKELNIQLMIDNQDIAYIADKLRQSCSSLTKEAISKTKYQFGLLPEVLSYVERKNLLEIPVVALFYYCYKMLSQPEEAENFEQFKKLIFENSHQFPDEEARDLYLLANNFCIRQFNLGNRHYLKDQFEIYQDGLKKNYFLLEGYLSRFTYMNIVTLGINLKAYDWLEQFIHDYKNALKKDFRESVFSLHLALLKYEQKQYDDALQLLQKAEYKDLFMNISAKTLILKIFYEQDEFDPLLSHLSAMHIFIRRKKDLGYHRERYLNTIRFTKKLIEINPFDKQAKADLKNEIDATKVVGEKGWLLEQVDLL